MRRRRLFWQIFTSYIAVTLAALAAVGWYASRSLRDFYYEELERDLQARGFLVRERTAGSFRAPDRAGLEALVRELGKGTGTRLTLILASGEVIADSEEEPARMENHGDRQEFLDARAKGSGRSIHFSRTLKQDHMYVAIPVLDGGESLGVVRTSLPITPIDLTLRDAYLRIASVVLAVAVLAFAANAVFFRRTTRPVQALVDGAARFARGDLVHRLPVPDAEDLAELARAMNDMAAQLDDRIRTITRERNEREAILSSMIEGVIVVDAEENLKDLNGTAARWLRVGPAQVRGRALAEVIRHAELLAFVRRTLEGRGPLEEDLVFPDGGKRFLQAHGTIVRDADGRATGALIVLHDVTRIRKLETIRKDFVANVSHEIQTPTTSIKGFAETLLAGAMRDPEEAERFLGIIAKEADRVSAVVEDLLTLSRIEAGGGGAEIDRAEGSLKDVLEASLRDFQAKASEKEMRMELDCPDDLTARFSPSLLERAVGNLVDNAIKYSPPGKRIRVEAGREGAEVWIRVRDEGAGIEAEHLPRIFERFYRVDKARSREMGGTGLGLAIVKHIAQAHGGEVDVESAPGRGSTFTIHLPRA